MSENAINILLVEDELLVLDATAELLSDAGYNVVRASTCDEALAALHQGFHPSVVVTDINLQEGGDGLALSRCISELWPGIRIIIVSGSSRPTREEYPEEAVFFTKPYAPKALVDICAPSIQY